MMISQQMCRLRAQQTSLNRFVWSSEIAYGHVLSAVGRPKFDHGSKVMETFAHVTPEAWFPNAQGTSKYQVRTEEFLDHVGANTSQVCRLVIGAMYTYFDEYLSARAGSGKGSFLCRLSPRRMADAIVPLRLPTVLRADLIRHLRNCVVHDPSSIPDSPSHPSAIDWQQKLVTHAREGGWQFAPQDVGGAMKQVVGKVAKRIAEASATGKQLSPDFFYMLFTFTNLDALAFEVEEALIPAGAQLETSAMHLDHLIRRRDLVIPTELRLDGKVNTRGT